MNNEYFNLGVHGKELWESDKSFFGKNMYSRTYQEMCNTHINLYIKTPRKFLWKKSHKVGFIKFDHYTCNANLCIYDGYKRLKDQIMALVENIKTDSKTNTDCEESKQDAKDRKIIAKREKIVDAYLAQGN